MKYINVYESEIIPPVTGMVEYMMIGENELVEKDGMWWWQDEFGFPGEGWWIAGEDVKQTSGFEFGVLSSTTIELGSVTADTTGYTFTSSVPGYSSGYAVSVVVVRGERIDYLETFSIMPVILDEKGEVTKDEMEAFLTKVEKYEEEGIIEPGDNVWNRHCGVGHCYAYDTVEPPLKEVEGGYVYRDMIVPGEGDYLVHDDLPAGDDDYRHPPKIRIDYDKVVDFVISPGGLKTGYTFYFVDDDNWGYVTENEWGGLDGFYHVDGTPYKSAYLLSIIYVVTVESKDAIVRPVPGVIYVEEGKVLGYNPYGAMVTDMEGRKTYEYLTSVGQVFDVQRMLKIMTDNQYGTGVVMQFPKRSVQSITELKPAHRYFNIQEIYEPSTKQYCYELTFNNIDHGDDWSDVDTAFLVVFKRRMMDGLQISMYKYIGGMY